VEIVIRGARLEGRDEPHDLGIREGRIATIAPRVEEAGEVELEAEGRIVSPAFVDPHIHLDKVDVAPTLPANRSGTLGEAIELLHHSKRTSSVAQVAERAGQVIRRAVIAGTTVLRSHVDVDTVGGLVPLRGVLAAREEHAELCTVQIVAFPQEGILRDPGAADLMEEAVVQGADVVGGMPHWETDAESSRRHVEFCMDLAVRHDRDVDMHVDETDDPASRTFEMLVDATERRGWGGRVTASHCCAMAAWDAPYTERMIARAAEVGVRVITNPATNLMLQGRHDKEPRRRGIPPVKALLAGGVTMGCGQDCVNDTFYPFGVPDQLQVALILCHAAQMSTPTEVERALAMVRSEAAAVLRLPGAGPLAVGVPADLVVLDAASMPEALRFQAARRWVIHAGRIVAETQRKSSLLN
jgi:cytosine deaminase